MDQKGFTLLQMVITVAIIGILLSMATLQFGSMNKNTAIDSQTKTLSADLMAERSQAVYEKRRHAVVLSNTGFAVYSGSSVSASAIRSKSLVRPITPGSTQLVFDEWGGITINGDTSIMDIAICVQESNAAGVDSVVISRSRIQMGKNKTTGCSSVNIDIK